jgi:regulator of cell morphogenesis and NO signaling
MTINDATTVGEIVAAMPASARVFHEHGIDFCCGGKRPLAAVCLERRLSLPELVEAIEESAAADRELRDWTREPLSALIDHIVSTYHDALRRDLPRLEELAVKVQRAHGAKAPYLARLKDIVAELSVDMHSHMQKEELVLFPAIRSTERGIMHQSLLGPITMMEHEHVHAGNLLDESREITGEFARPEWACGSVHALFGGLAELDAAMRIHVHLENNILFPRAQQLATTTHAQS